MMLENFRLKLPLRILLVGLVYFGGAWLGVTQTVTPDGIAILWPPNAVLLAAFLLFPYRHWTWLAVVTLVAELLADLPAFPIWVALGFGVTNLFEVSLAAWLIRRGNGPEFDFNGLKRGVYFLLYGPLLASSLAALMGAEIYVLMGRSDTGFWTLWRLWWFGDALGLLLVTPFFMVAWRWVRDGIPRPNWPMLLELALLWALLVYTGYYVFSLGIGKDLNFQLTPVILLPFSLWAAVRFGVVGASLTIIVHAAMAVGFMVRGIHPYKDFPAQLGVWLLQENLAVVALTSIGLAILLREIRIQKEELELRVQERTASLEAAVERLNELASTDYLTGIINRRHFQDVAQRELVRLGRYGNSASLILFDLDHFKQVNDRYGHEAGDAVLRDVVGEVQEVVRPMDMFGRYGGEEFLILLPDTGAEIARQVAERMRRKVEESHSVYRGQQIRVTISLGIAQWNGRDDLSELIRQADSALYQAKKAGRNRVELSAPE
jgi:diguanylate cyclase (GGDEF)-like protein